METLVLTLDTIALMVVLYFSFKGDRMPGKPELGPFRLRSPNPPAGPKPANRDPRLGRR